MFFIRDGITVEQLLTDNGSGYRSALHAIACPALGPVTYEPSPTGPRPTAGQNDSSAPSSPAGPTAPLPKPHQTHRSP
jgi:hypothetical protein